jgi:hypothetical protein
MSTNFYDELSLPSLESDSLPRPPDPVRLIRGYTGLVGGRQRCGWSLVLAVMNTRVGVSSLMAQAMGSAIRFGCFLRLVCVSVVLGWC